MKISEAFDEYCEFIVLKKYSIRMVETTERVGKTLSQFLSDKDVVEITLQDISKWIKKISVGRSTNTVRNDVICFRSVLRFLYLRDYKVVNPELVPIPKRRDTLPTFLTADDVTSMINCAYNLRNKFVISLLYSSGIRLSEMISLNRGDICDRQFSVVGKGGKARLCFIDKRTEKLMNKYLDARTDNCEALIISYKNKARMTPTNVQLLVSNSARRACITKKVTPHTLRHSFATNFLKNNGNMRYLSQMMGHANLNTTARYAHVVDYDLRNQYEKFHTC